MKAFLALSIVGFATCASAVAQERTVNPGTQAVLRAWPDTGMWGVALVRLVGGDLGCILATHHANATTGERYFWGVRKRNQSFAATITDNNEQAVASPAIQIIIDQVPLGAYQITRRSNLGNGFQNVVAELSGDDAKRLVNLISVGGTMQFVTGTATYSASLQGAQQALVNLQACAIEADHLNAASTASTRDPNR